LKDLRTAKEENAIVDRVWNVTQWELQQLIGLTAPHVCTFSIYTLLLAGICRWTGDRNDERPKVLLI
jgi:hypothetical protein